MRTVLSVLIFVMWNCCVLAQQKPHYTQYIQNQYIINPALSGIEMYTEMLIQEVRNFGMNTRHLMPTMAGGYRLLMTVQDL